MPRVSCIWLLLAGGFLCLLVNSIWTKHQINEILAREFSSGSQVEPDLRWQSRIKIRIRGNQFGGTNIGNKGAQRASAMAAYRNSVSQQEQARLMSSDGLQTERVPSSWQSHHSTQGIQDAGSVLDKTTSQLRPTHKEDSFAGAGLQGVKTSMNEQPRTDSIEQSQAANPESNVATGSTAAAHLPVRGSAPSLVGLPQTERSPPADSPQPEVEAAVQGAISVAGSWNAALGQGTAVPLLTAIPEEPTPAMLQYAAAPAQLPPSGMTCEAWLGQADQRRYSRDFAKEPVTVLVHPFETVPDVAGCDVPCVFTRQNTSRSVQTPEGPLPAYDAHPGIQQGPHSGITYFRHMESITNYPDRAIENMHATGIQIVMSPQLSSDVPAGYLSWAEYDFMAPPREKAAAAVAFISNCGAQSFRLEAVQQLGTAVEVHSYGACEHNMDAGGASKEDVLPSYHFTLAFENSQEEDYVTEKYAQALVAGSVPVVIGATNIKDYAVAHNSMLVLQTKEDIMQVGLTMQRLLQNESAYGDMLAWKMEGPQDSFLALVDLNAVHSDCRLCVKLADNVLAQEEAGMPPPPCKCRRAMAGPTVHHIMARERSTFHYRDLYLEDRDLTVDGLHAAIRGAFAGHTPVWADQRPDFRAQSQVRETVKGQHSDLSIYRVYQVGHTQRAALYGEADLDSDVKVRQSLTHNPCLQLEVIFI